MAAKKGLELLYNLLLKDAIKTSGPRSGILSIGPDTRKFAQKRFEAFVEGALRQGVDLDKYTEQELRYIIELNKKPKSPNVIPADSPKGKGITEALFGKKGEVIKADFGEPFAEQAKKFKGPVQKTEDMGKLGKVNVDIDYSASLDKPEFFGADAKNMFGEPVKTGSEYFKDMKQFHLNQINRKKKEMVPPTHSNYKTLKKSLQDQEDSLVAAQIAEELGGNQNMYDFLRTKQISDPNAKPLKKSDYVKIDDPEDMATGGRAGFKDGMSRRKFLQIMGGLGSMPILGKFLKFGKAAKVVNPVKTPIVKLENTTTQMPEWFPSFVNKFRNEGKAENVFKQKKIEVSKAEYDKAIAEGKGEKYGTDVARTEEYKANNPDHMDYFKLEDTDELLYTKYTNKNVPGVQVDDMKGEVEVLFENYYSQPVTINYTSPGKKGPNLGRTDEILQDIATKETKQKGDFAAVDADVYATSPDGDYDVEPVITKTLDEMMEGTTRTMEEYATGQKVKKLSKGEGKVIEAEIRAEQAADAAAEAADDFASGGIAGMLGE